MTVNPLIVIGSGPAGVAAALAAASSVPTILLDEQPGPGGHLRWWPGRHVPALSDQLAKQLGDAGVDYRPGTAVWGLFDGPTVAAYNSERAISIRASVVIVATGTVDRTWPVPGWHLDGVVSPRQVLLALSEGRIKPGTRAGVVGAGPNPEGFNDGLAAAGAEVTYRASDLAGVRIEGDGRVECLHGPEGSAPVDLVVLALGRRPDPSLALQARAKSGFSRHQLIEMPWLANDGATSLPGVFVAGEAAGIEGFDAVTAHGAKVGSAAAMVALGEPQSVPERVPVNSDAFIDMTIPDDPATIICREQMIDFGTVLHAIDSGAYDVNDLRRKTRAGMGASWDAMSVLAALMLRHDPSIPDERLVARVRPPARPLPFRAVLTTSAD